jgi:cobalt/nickel transport system permease protein
MALMSAFCFVIQMLNIPLPGGTTGHAVGASLAALIVGPWPAVISVSVALTIQALFFGDGGITTLGANCFNMAVIQVWITYAVYRLLPGKRPIIAAVAAFVGVNVAAFATAILLGLQPLIAQKADGTPLYAPYPLSIAIPAMMIGHIVAGFAESVVTAAGITYALKVMPEILTQKVSEQDDSQKTGWLRLKHAWLVLAVLMFLTPLGLLAPGTAWGEWSSDQLKEIGFNFVPEGLKKWEGFWNAILPDYTIPGLGENTGYLLSALAGVGIIISIYMFTNFLFRHFKQETSVQS